MNSPRLNMDNLPHISKLVMEVNDNMVHILVKYTWLTSPTF